MNPQNPFASADTRPTCKEMLQTILDGQANEEQIAYFKDHMCACLPCHNSYDLEIAIKQMLQTKCCGGEAPADLVARIKSQLSISA
jgi:mycothiol system anti-sigma-R factor